MKPLTIIILTWAILFSPFVIYFVQNYRRQTKIDRMQDRKAKEFERKRRDQIIYMRQRRETFKKLRKP